MPYLQRKYIDLIRQVSSKWVNWDPPIPIEVGAYGYVEKDTGELRVDGNIYDPEFQAELDKLGLSLRLSKHPAQEGSPEEDFIIASKGAKQLNLHLGPEASVPGIATASLKGQWQFEHGRRDALLIMHSPRIRYLPRDVILETLYRVPKLSDKWLVTSIHVCPAFSMYLSNKSGEKLSLALVAQVPPGVPGITAGGEGGFGWWSNIQADLLRKACDKGGNYCFTPLYTMKRQIRLYDRIFRDGEEHGTPSGDDLWQDVTQPWDPLNEDGEEDSLDVDEPEDADDLQ